MSIEINELSPDLQEFIAGFERMLQGAASSCGECGWLGVVLEYLPAFGGLAAFGANGHPYCPECGEIFRERAHKGAPKRGKTPAKIRK